MANWIKIMILSLGITLPNSIVNCRTIPTHGMLMKRASELRDILGLSKCSSLLSANLNKQHAEPKVHHPTEKPTTPVSMKRTPSTLRAEATEWTPPTGTESPGKILKNVLQLGTNGEKP